MSDQQRVWISRRSNKGKDSYHLRWLDPVTGKWRSRAAGTDRKQANREAAILEKELAQGTYRDLRKVTWTEFVEEHVQMIQGDRDRAEAKRTLEEFGRRFNVPLRAVRYGMIESYVEWLKAEKKNKIATINKKLRYLRAAFNKAVKRGYLAESPMRFWQMTREQEKPIRIASDEDEQAMLKAAQETHGELLRAFVQIALATGGRRSELLTLPWENVIIEETPEGDKPCVRFMGTKGKKIRRVPLDQADVDILRRLKLKTLKDGGPFIALARDLDDMWADMLAVAKVAHITPHDLRRTFVTRLVRAEVPLPTVQKLAGHSTITTTLSYYNQVNADDLQRGMEKLWKARAAG